mgnify:CR=1 FL=1
MKLLEDTKCPNCGAVFETLFIESNANPMLDEIRCPCGWASNLIVFKVAAGVPTEFDAKLSAILLSPWMPSERPLEDLCPKCGKPLVRVHAPAWGTWGGWVKCKACDYKVTALRHIGKQMFKVEPMTEGKHE